MDRKLPEETEYYAEIARIAQKNMADSNPKKATFVQDVAELVSKEDWMQLFSLLLNEVDPLFQANEGRDVDGFFKTLTTLVFNVSGPVILAEPVEKLVAKVVSKKDVPFLRISILGQIFNRLPRESSLRYTVFRAIVTFAGTSSNMHHLIGFLNNVETWVKEWGCSMDQTRSLFLDLSQYLGEFGHSRMSFDFLVRFLKTYQGTNENTLKGVKDKAELVIEQGLQLDGTQHLMTLKRLDAVQFIKSSPHYELLSILLEGNLANFEAFQKKNASLMKSKGLDGERILEKIHLHSIASLASQHAEIPYDLLKKTLKVDEDQVELWIIKAISNGLVQARLDQVNRVAIIQSSTFSRSDDVDWDVIFDRLSAWKQSAKALQTIVHKAKGEGVAT